MRRRLALDRGVDARGSPRSRSPSATRATSAVEVEVARARRRRAATACRRARGSAPLMAPARSSAQRSATSSTTTSTCGRGAGRGRSCRDRSVSTLPQAEQTTTALARRPAWRRRAAPSSCSRFLMRCSAARRAERGPSPGRRASNWIRRSISAAGDAFGHVESERQLHAGRQRQAGGRSTCIFSAMARSAFRVRLRAAVTIRSSRISFSSAVQKRWSMAIAFIAPLAVIVTFTMPRPAGPRLELSRARPAVAAIFVCMACACFISPMKSFMSSLPDRASESSSESDRIVIGDSSARSSSAGVGGPTAARLRARSRRTATISAPGKRSSTLRTSGSACTPSCGRAPSPPPCSRNVGAPGSDEIATIQRMPVQSAKLAHERLRELRRGAGPGRIRASLPRSVPGERRVPARS